MVEPDKSGAVFPEFRGAAIDELISRPMVAIVKANEKMATEQVKLLMNICFSKSGDVYEPVMITMSIRRGALEPADDRECVSILNVETTFQVPLITLLPITSLAIDSADIDFDMDVHSQYEVSEEDDGMRFGGAKTSKPNSHELVGSIRYASRGEPLGAEIDDSRGANVSISVSARPLPLPLGVSTILQAYSQSIYPSDVSWKPEATRREG